MMHSRDTRQPHSARTSGPDRLTELFETVRRRTQDLTEPLSAEDQCIQSMPDVSPSKWHLAHTTWFFETFILKPHARGYAEFHPDFSFLFNSYYEQVGPRHERPKRGLLSRPPHEDVLAYRAHVDEAMTAFERTGDANRPEIRELLELGCHHEQQHQELMLTDIKHVLSCNPLKPAYQPPRPRDASRTRTWDWIEHAGGLVEIGHDGAGFAFDCEGPRHKVWLEPFKLASRPVTNGEYLAFIEDGGYGRSEFWLSDGWAACQANGWQAPLYWEPAADGTWRIFTLAGLRPLDPDAAGLPRQLLRGRRLCALGRKAAADRGRVGGRRHTADTRRQFRRYARIPSPAGARRRTAPDLRRCLGMDRQPLPALSGLPGRRRCGRRI